MPYNKSKLFFFDCLSKIPKIKNILIILDPFLLALKKIQYYPFVQRTVEIYKNPTLTNDSNNSFQHEFTDLCIGLALSELTVFFIIQFFPEHLEFDPFKIMYMAPLALEIIVSALSLSACIAFFSFLFLKLLKVKHHQTVPLCIFWRVCRVYAITLPIMTYMALELLNAILKTDSYNLSNANSWETVVYILLTGIFCFTLMKLLLLPIYNIFKPRGRLISLACIFIILLFATKTNELLAEFIAPKNIINQIEFNQAYSAFRNSCT